MMGDFEDQGRIMEMVWIVEEERKEKAESIIGQYTWPYLSQSSLFW